MKIVSVYVAGPLESSGDLMLNIRLAIQVGNRLASRLRFLRIG